MLQRKKRYAIVATGGTFDIIHDGHKKLLKTAFDVSDMVIVGLTSDQLAARMSKSPLNDYQKRRANLAGFLDALQGSFQISRLDDDFGPAVLEEKVEALVTSEETAAKGQRLNAARAAMNRPPAEIVVVPMLMAEDGHRISTSRIRRAEIDAGGNTVSNDA